MYWVDLEIDPRISHTGGLCSSPELYPLPFVLFWSLSQRLQSVTFMSQSAESWNYRSELCQRFQILRGPSSVQSVFFRPGWFCTLLTSCSLAIECDNIQDVTWISSPSPASSEIISALQLHEILFLVNICEQADPFLWFSVVDGLDCGSALARFSGVLLLAFSADVCRCAARALGEHSPLIIACDLNKIACSFKMEEL